MERNYRKRHWPEPWVPPKAPAPDTLKGKDVRLLIDWMDSIVEWGKNVRDDIIRLESTARIGMGDPGDPPPSPWRKEKEIQSG